jgi:hypothetical protein
MARPTKIRQMLKQAGELPQSEAIWECSVRKAPVWHESRNGNVSRATMVVVVEAVSGLVRFIDMPKGQPNADTVVLGVLKAMLEPSGSAFLPDTDVMRTDRPLRVQFDWPARLEEVQKLLGEIGVAVEPAEALPACDEMYQSLLDYMNPGPRPAAISRIAPGNPALTSEYFDAADTFYRSGVWQYVFNDDIIEVRYGDEPARYCSIMGNGGQEFGIVLYNSLDDITEVLTAGDPMAMRRGMIWLTTSFDEAFVSAIEDIDYMEKHRIAPADMMAFPLFLRVRMPTSMESPDALEMRISAAVLRVLPQFVVASMMAGEGEPQAATATLALPEVHAGRTVTLVYPVAGLMDRIKQMDETLDESTGLQAPFLNPRGALGAGDGMDDDLLDAMEMEADAIAAEMIERAEQVEPGSGRLLQAINTVEPAVSFMIEKDVLDHIKPKPRGMKAGVFYESFTSMYADPHIGIMVVFVLPKNDMPIVIPMAMLNVDPSHPLADAIQRYQQSRSNAS